MRTSTVQAAADANRIIRTTLLGIPTATRLAIFGQPYVVEDLHELFAAYQVADVSAELFR